jgi:hypothetical protein
LSRFDLTDRKFPGTEGLKICGSKRHDHERELTVKSKCDQDGRLLICTSHPGRVCPSKRWTRYSTHSSRQDLKAPAWD